MKAVPRNVIRYTAGKGEARATISGIGYGRNMETVSGGPDDIRTMIFPATVRKVRQGLFCGMKSLVSVVLNEGLEAPGRTSLWRRYNVVWSLFEKYVGEHGAPFNDEKNRIRAFSECRRLKTITTESARAH